MSGMGRRPPPEGGVPGWYPSLLAEGMFRLWNGTDWEMAWQLEGEGAKPELWRMGYPLVRVAPVVDEATLNELRAAEQTSRVHIAQMELQAHDGDPSTRALLWVRGHTIHWWGFDFKAMKAESRYDEALAVADACMMAIEERSLESGEPLAWGWHWDAAVVARKARQFDYEVEIISRVLTINIFGDESRSQWEARLAKAEELAAGRRPW